LYALNLNQNFISEVNAARVNEVTVRVIFSIYVSIEARYRSSVENESSDDLIAEAMLLRKDEEAYSIIDPSPDHSIHRITKPDSSCNQFTL